MRDGVFLREEAMAIFAHAKARRREEYEEEWRHVLPLRGNSRHR
jgi:hypothetical protein